MTSRNNVVAMTLQIVGGTLIAVYALRSLALIGDFGEDRHSKSSCKASFSECS